MKKAPLIRATISRVIIFLFMAVFLPIISAPSKAEAALNYTSIGNGGYSLERMIITDNGILWFVR